MWTMSEAMSDLLSFFRNLFDSSDFLPRHT